MTTEMEKKADTSSNFNRAAVVDDSKKSDQKVAPGSPPTSGDVKTPATGTSTMGATPAGAKVDATKDHR